MSSLATGLRHGAPSEGRLGRGAETGPTELGWGTSELHALNQSQPSVVTLAGRVSQKCRAGVGVGRTTVAARGCISSRWAELPQKLTLGAARRHC